MKEKRHGCLLSSKHYRRRSLSSTLYIRHKGHTFCHFQLFVSTQSSDCRSLWSHSRSRFEFYIIQHELIGIVQFKALGWVDYVGCTLPLFERQPMSRISLNILFSDAQILKMR